MPRAGGSIAEQVKYHYQDHDTAEVKEVPPVQNTWYGEMEAEDVRHILCSAFQTNDEAAIKDVEIRWTIDGHVYFLAFSLPNNSRRLLARNHAPSAGGAAGLAQYDSMMNAGAYVDKRGHAYKTEIRMTSAPGTNQVLEMRDVYETLEET